MLTSTLNSVPRSVTTAVGVRTTNVDRDLGYGNFPLDGPDRCFHPGGQFAERRKPPAGESTS